MDQPSDAPAKPTPPRRAAGLDEGPALFAVPFRRPSRGKARPLFSPQERAALATISTHVTVRKGATLYREGDAATFVYVITGGYVRTVRRLPTGTERVTAFRSGGDLLGLATEGRYVATAQAIATTSAYQVPTAALEELLQTDASLALRLLCKLSSIVVAQQHHALILGRTDALGKLAMFLEMLEQRQHERGWDTEIIYLPMSRSDIADYVGLSVEAVSRAVSTLRAEAVVSCRTKLQFRVSDRPRFRELIGGGRRRSRPAKPKREPIPSPAAEDL
ncbi:MAG TPA: Crp/Fnr family transcriptional regulator [Stellaceae bacterium]|nr:Crp/Fnr family transcriptional regulator [Stellaceae bacterium]